MEIYRARRSNRHAKGELSVSSNGIRVRGSAFQHLRQSSFVLIGVDNGQLILKRSDDPSNLKLRLAAKGTTGEVGGKHLTHWLLERGFKKGQYKVTMLEDGVMVNQELA
ncbi:MAG: M20 family metallopeptidase [Clostridia bacterium]|nr:M20 family metallopeptidase [Clostridia bacterium]